MGRKRPVKHTVHTRHPRYRVPNYPRGRGEGHSGERLRKTIKMSGYDPQFYCEFKSPFFRDYTFIAPKPYLSGRRTLKFGWSKIIVDDAKWRAFLKKYGFKKVTSGADGSVIWKNSKGMYVVQSRDNDGKGANWFRSWAGKKVRDVGSLRFEAHPKDEEILSNMVRDLRGYTRVSEMDTTYEPRERGMLVWSKDGETQPSQRDYLPVSEQKELLREDIKFLEGTSDADTSKRRYEIRHKKAQLDALEGIKD